jgi:hypothetical protein
MAKFTYFIRERVKLDGVERGTNFETSITGINYADSRTMSIPSGSITEILNLNNLPGAGTFVSSSVKYIRVTNFSTGPVNLQVSGSTAELNFLLQASGSFMINSEYVNETFDNFEYGDLRSIKASPVNSQATIGYFIVAT